MGVEFTGLLDCRRAGRSAGEPYLSLHPPVLFIYPHFHLLLKLDPADFLFAPRAAPPAPPTTPSFTIHSHRQIFPTGLCPQHAVEALGPLFVTHPRNTTRGRRAYIGLLAFVPVTKVA